MTKSGVFASVRKMRIYSSTKDIRKKKRSDRFRLISLLASKLGGGDAKVTLEHFLHSCRLGKLILKDIRQKYKRFYFVLKFFFM
jgi:hypothetical protein